MNLQRLAVTLLCIVLCSHAFAQDIDSQLSDMATNLAAQIDSQGKKKVAVLDFTDLQGGSSELGKYIAEQLTVNLVMGKKQFSVLDRANLRSILAEHKLTSEGLIDPANAKQLGLFSGVDALILGTIIPKGQKIGLNAKIITTDTAEIIGAARAEFKPDATTQQLAAKPVQREDVASVMQPPSDSPVPKPFGDLEAKVVSLQIIPGDNNYGYAHLNLIINNTSPSKTYGVALNPDFYNKFNLSSARGDEFHATDVSGVQTAFKSFGGFSGALTDVYPNSSITIAAKCQVRWNGRPGDYRPYQLQTEVVFGAESNGRHPNLREYNLVLSIK